MIIWSSINCPTVIVFPPFVFFLERSHKWNLRPLGLFLILFAFAIYFPLLLFSDLLNQKYFAALYFICDLFIQSITTFSCQHAISGTVTRKELTTPLTRWVAMCCYLCAWAVYVVLLGSPTGSITLVSYLREIPTAAVLHHPFLFGEIPT